MSRKSKKEQHKKDTDAELPAETNANLSESAAEKNEAGDPTVGQVENTLSPVEEGAAAAAPSDLESDELSPDDLLDDVRRSLIEDEAQENREQPKWWKRIGRGSRKNAEPEEPKVVEEINLPNLDAEEIVTETQPETSPEEPIDPIDELLDLLDKEDVAAKKPAAVEETPPEPENAPDIEELKKQAFQPRPAATQEEDLTEVRAIALEGEEVFVEVQATREDQLEERLKGVENALQPYKRYIYFGIAVLGLVMAVIAGMVLLTAYNRTLGAPTPEVVSNVPFPTSVSLPGGWTFQLGKGSLVDGNWNPKGAEWLQGTEVCRWVALPWSRQLEAVIRTLNPDDPINLGMSNNDVLTYKVYSVEQMSPEEMQKLDSNTPCLLVVLAEPDAEKRWVLTALP